MDLWISFYRPYMLLGAVGLKMCPIITGADARPKIWHLSCKKCGYCLLPSPTTVTLMKGSVVEIVAVQHRREREPGWHNYAH